MKKIINIPCKVCGEDTGSSVSVNADAKQDEIDRKCSGYKHAKCSESEPAIVPPFLRNGVVDKEERLKAFAAKWDGKPMTQEALMEMFSIMRS